MEKRLQQWLVGTLVVAGIGAAGLMWNSSTRETAVDVAGVPPPDAPRAAVPVPAQAVSAAVPASVLAAAVNPNLSAHVADLLASHDPYDAYAAYMLVSGCASFNRRHDLEMHDNKLGAKRVLNAEERRNMTRMCGAMTERERLARLDYLATAVKAGVPGAAWMHAVEGPFGDPSALTTRPDDPPGARMEGDGGQPARHGGRGGRHDRTDVVGNAEAGRLRPDRQASGAGVWLSARGWPDRRGGRAAWRPVAADVRRGQRVADRARGAADAGAAGGRPGRGAPHRCGCKSTA